ncbi:MAG: alpha/beta hydrolase [Firmicutes bacterium]|nr:alpha/beta hydrolase [Bacillota bacterium]
MKVIRMFLITAMVFSNLFTINFLLAAEERLIPPEDFTYFVARDGIKIYYQELKAKGTAKGTVVFLQGINGGGSRTAVNDALAENGFGSVIVHQRGTGYSEGVKGDLESFDIVETDYQELLDLLKKKEPGLPLFILGHSIGGDFCIWIAANRADLAGVILVNPATKFPVTKVPFTIKMKFMFDYFFRPRALTIDVSPPQKISNERDRKEIEATAQDKLSLKKMSVRYAMAAQKLWNESVNNASAANSPVLIIYGGQDDVVDHSETEKVYEVWKHPRKTKIILPDAGHGLHIFDQCTEQIIDWLNKAAAEA